MPDDCATTTPSKLAWPLLGCMYEYYAWRCDVELFNKWSRGTLEWQDRKHPDTPNMKLQTKSKLPSHSILKSIVWILCGYSAGILRNLWIVFFAPFCFEFAKVLRQGMVEGSWGWHESLRWRPTCTAGSLLEMSGSSGVIQGIPPFQECS